MPISDKVKALNASIRHWQRVLIGRDRIVDCTTCALCVMYRPRNTYNCDGCPLVEYGMKCSDSSPWHDVYNVTIYDTFGRLVLPPTDKMVEAFEIMLLALMFVREAVKDEEKQSCGILNQGPSNMQKPLLQ